MPVFNERRFLPRSLRSLAGQDTDFELILVDNGSTDGSGLLAEQVMARLGISGRVVLERTPGTVPALARGLAEADTEFVATCDADTFYPRSYLSTAQGLFDADPAASMASAYFLPPKASAGRRLTAAIHQLTAAFVWPRQAHNGGAGQCFRTAVLNAQGGYGTHLWPLVLADHEIVHRMLKVGRQVWHGDLWCIPSDRRQDEDAVRWSLGERLLYHFTPFALKDWYFYQFLSPRLIRRGLDSTRLRVRDWSEEGFYGLHTVRG